MLASLYSAHRDGAEECDLTSLIESHGLSWRLPEYGGKAQLRSLRATLRRTFRTLEARRLVECETKTEPHPSIDWPFASDATIERLYLRITAAGVDYVESRGLTSLGPPGSGSRRSRRAALAADNDEWASLDRDRAESAGSGRVAELDLRERRLVDAALKRGAT